MTVDIAPSSITLSAAGRGATAITLSAAGRGATAVPARSRLGLLARCGAWLRRLNDARALRGIEPRLARDIGAAPGCDRCPDGFACDPRPLWGIGLTPQPMDVAPPWSCDRRGG
jgi:hypothetical protein